MIRIYAVLTPHGKGWFPLLFSACTRKNLPGVSLSRNDGACYFGIDQLHNHNDHAPAFDTKTEALEYLKRVAKDIPMCLAGYNLSSFPANDVIEIFSMGAPKKL